MVGVDQAQIDKILAGASADDPEERLDALEKELNFVKTSIKRLLIDLRERMNELDNPFTTAAAYTENRFEQLRDLQDPEDDTRDSESEEEVSGPDDTCSAACLQQDAEERPLDPAISSLDMDRSPSPAETTTGAHPLPEGPSTPPLAEPPGKLKLQRIHRLFEWVSQGCRKYGHEHMAVMIDAYRSMGYITDEASGQIREIMRIVPETRRDVQEIGPDEFVSELYVLNRILDPEDSTLDREMIEVLMLTRRNPGEQGTKKLAAHEREASDTWINLLDRI